MNLKTTISGDSIVISNNDTTIRMTLGSKNALVNGIVKTMSVAPVKLKFNETIKYYVPTRFVAESFGYEYTWVSNISTVKLEKPLNLSVKNNETLYTDSFYSITYDSNEVNLVLPAINYNGTIFAPAKSLFEAIGCQYNEQNSCITIRKGDITIDLELNNKNACINNKKYIMRTAPFVVSDSISDQQYNYVPLEFVVEMLGFSIIYEETLENYAIFNTEYTGNVQLHPELKTIAAKKTVDSTSQTPIKYYYEWTAEEPATHEKKYINKVVAYALENADVVELYGIKRDDIVDFIDSSMLVFELKDVLTTMETQYFSDYSTPHLNYTLMTGLNTNTKLFFMIPAEDEWHFIEKEECVQVYFMKADLSLADLLVSSVTNPEEQAFPDDKLVIPMPKKLDIAQLKEEDNYLEHSFRFIMPGDYLSFYEQNPIQNPYLYLETIDIVYEAETDSTIITCTTDTICGYTYELENGYLAVTVASPNEIYDKIIVLDAGHGGKDPGAVQGDCYEKNLNFTILNTYVNDLFKNSDIKVYFTRETDTYISLKNRAKFASEVGADLFISLHMNSSTMDYVSGTEIFYSSANNSTQPSGLRSYLLAKTLSSYITQAMDTTNRGVTNSDFYVVKYNKVPAVLIELGFITNATELSKLKDTVYQKKAADAIYESVLEIFKTYPTGR